MFHHIEGIVSEIESNLVVIDCGGVGFEVNTSLNTLSQIKVGQKAKLYVTETIREDCFDLYGFASKHERRSYGLLTSVSGVGPKAAISILSSSTPDKLALAIISGDEKALTVAPGIGKKIAQRVILELKDKIAKDSETFNLSAATAQVAVGMTEDGKLGDVAAALAVLGYGTAEISAGLRGVNVSELSVEQIIKAALKNMMK